MKGGGPALIIGVGKPKKGDDEGSPEEERDESPEEADAEGDRKDMHLDDAFDAMQSGDREAFKEAMKKCLLASDEGAYSGPDDEGEG